MALPLRGIFSFKKNKMELVVLCVLSKCSTPELDFQLWEAFNIHL